MAAENPIVGEKSRTALLAETEQARKAFDLAPEDISARYTYASLLYQGGDFWRAWEIAQELVHQPDTLPEHLTLTAKLAFLLGDYASAEQLYNDLVSATRKDVSANVSALVDLMFTYYEQDKFDAIKALTFPAGVDLPQHRAIAAFEGQPYELEWHTDEHTAVVPFVLTDPVPLLMIEVNGVPIAVFFDSGADTLILDPDVANALGIAVTATAKGPFGGGLEAEFGFGQIASLRLNNVTLKQVPVMILLTKRFSEVYPDRGIILGGVIGTALLRQLLATLDYAQGRLILRERSAASRESLLTDQQSKEVVEVPFRWTIRI